MRVIGATTPAAPSDMAARGIISRSAGSKPREVLISYEQYLQQKDAYLH